MDKTTLARLDAPSPRLHVMEVVGNGIVGGIIPKEYIPAVKKGIEEAVLNGVVGGYPVVDVNVDIIDGSYHDVDSNEMAFKIAAKEAFKKGILQGQPILLEPDDKTEGRHGGQDEGETV